MKNSHRRQMLGSLAAVLAAPLSLGRLGVDAFSDAGEPPKFEPKSLRERDESAIRPKIAAPKGSVMRRG